MRVLDLFSGIGGFSLGLERAGFTTVAFCEIDPYARAVLRKHWPDTAIPIYEDVRTVTADRLRADGIDAQVITAGFPCQDISYAGKGAGLAGERSGLWREVARLVSELRPHYVCLENVSALLSRGLGDVLGDLAEIGYDAEWHCIPASAIGAPHRRDRIWIVAHPHQPTLEGWVGASVQERAREWLAGARGASDEGRTVDDAERGRHGPQESEVRSGWDGVVDAGWWLTEPDVGRVAHGVPRRVDRLRCLGNAVVPQVVEVIGRAIMEAESAYSADTNAITGTQAAGDAEQAETPANIDGAGGGTRTPDPHYECQDSPVKASKHKGYHDSEQR